MLCLLKKVYFVFNYSHVINLIIIIVITQLRDLSVTVKYINY